MRHRKELIAGPVDVRWLSLEESEAEERGEGNGAVVLCMKNARQQSRVGEPDHSDHVCTTRPWYRPGTPILPPHNLIARS